MATTRGEKLPVWMKAGFGFGDFANQFVYTTIAIYFMYFFTDVALMGAAAGGLILFIARGWDAFADLLMGYISDHTRSRWGQKRPYMLFGALPLGVSFFLLFASPAIADEYRFAYYLAVSILTWTLYTVVSIPYNALIPNMTLDSGERSSLAGYKMFFTIIAILIIGALTKPMVARFETEAQGFRMVALLFGAIVFVSYLVVFFSVRERVHVSDRERYGLKEVFSLIGKNKPFIILSAATFCGFIAATVLGACINYFFKYNIKNESFIPIAFTCIFGFAALGLPLWVFLSNRIGKKNVFIISSIIYGAALLCIFFIRNFDTRIMFSVFIVTGLTYSGIQLCQWSMIPDTVEYAQYTTGRRPEGIIYGLYTFILKLAVAIGSVIVGSGLDLAGYVPNVEQSESSLLGIRLLMSVVPFAVTMISVAVMYFYPITEKTHREMLSAIQRQQMN